jgi:putative Mn2+ efflux pump MntP
MFSLMQLVSQNVGGAEENKLQDWRLAVIMAVVIKINRLRMGSVLANLIPLNNYLSAL